MNNEDKKRLMEERARMRAKIAQGADIIDPIVRVRFRNLEDPMTQSKPSPPLEFTFQTPKMIMLTFKISREEGIPDTALRDGQIYELPVSVVNHINELKKPIWGQRQHKDPLTGAMMIVNYIAGYQTRFACTPVDMSNYQVVDDGQSKLNDERPSRESEQDDTNKELADIVDETNRDLANLSSV